MEEIVASNKEDIAIRIREKSIEQTVLNRLQNEAIQQYTQQKKTSLFKKLFNSTQVEIEKKLYITAYVEENYSNQLSVALHEYHKHFLEY